MLPLRSRSYPLPFHLTASNKIPTDAVLDDNGVEIRPFDDHSVDLSLFWIERLRVQSASMLGYELKGSDRIDVYVTPQSVFRTVFFKETLLGTLTPEVGPGRSRRAASRHHPFDSPPPLDLEQKPVLFFKNAVIDIGGLVWFRAAPRVSWPRTGSSLEDE